MTAKILFELIQNMSKEEKRFFKILNDSQNKNKKYVLLFDFIDKSNKYTDDVMVRFAEKYNLSNSVVSSRNYLGEMILHSLTIFQLKKNIEYDIVKIKVLYERGFFEEALKILKSVKKACIKKQEPYLMSQILELEIGIMLRKMKDINEITDIITIRRESIDNFQQNEHISKINLLYIQLIYTIHKYNKKEISLKDCHAFLMDTKQQAEQLEKRTEHALAKSMLYSLMILLYTELENKILYSKYMKYYIKLVDESPQIFRIMPLINYITMGINTCLHMQLYEEALLLLQKLEQLSPQKSHEKRFQYHSYYLSLLKYANKTEQFDEINSKITHLENFIYKNEKHFEANDKKTLYQAMASYYFRQKNFSTCIDCLQAIFNEGLPVSDAQYFESWLIYGISQMELGNDRVAIHVFQNTYRTLKRHDLLTEEQRTILLNLKYINNQNIMTKNYEKLAIILEKNEKLNCLKDWINDKLLINF